jgi:hypothetical protein
MFEDVPDLNVTEVRHFIDEGMRPKLSVTEKDLTVQIRQAGACTILDVSGRMTIDSSFQLRPVLHAAVAAASPAGIVIDFTRTTYLDTSAAATLIDAAIRGLR